MSNALYAKGRESFLKGEISWNADAIKAVLVDTDQYTVNLAAHQFLSDVPTGARVATSSAFTGKTTGNGIADANDLTYPTVSGPTIEALVIYQDTGDPATSRLIAYIDSATGLPVTPNGGGVNVVWDDGANRIFKL